MYVLCILTSKWVLCMPLAGRNHIFQYFNIFSHDKWKIQVKGQKRENRLKRCQRKGFLYDIFPTSWPGFGCQPAFMSSTLTLVGSFLYVFLIFFLFVIAKNVKMQKEMILTRKQHVKHLYAGQNTQHVF